MSTLKRVLFFYFLLTIFSLEAQSEEFIPLRVIFHINSNISEGQYSLSEIAKIAKEEGIGGVIFTDKALLKWEYGLWPLRNVIKKKLEDSSVFKYGLHNYLQDIRRLRKEFPNLVLIEGLEVAPFYYWEGSPLRGNLRMYNWHKHLLVLGLKEKDYKYLPIIGNFRGLVKNFSFYKLWPVLLMGAGFILIRKKRYKYKDFQGRVWGKSSPAFKFSGFLCMGLGVLFFINNWPFVNLRYTQYDGDLEIKPYQEFINYVRDKGGLVFWAEPEAETRGKFRGIHFESKSCVEEFLHTQGYSGFCVFYDGYKEIGRPGGAWDRVLLEYCRDIRDNPAWAIGGLSFERGDLSRAIRDLQTVVLAKRKDKASVLEALKKGRFYVIRGINSLDFLLEDFSLVSDLAQKARLGEVLRGKRQVAINIKASSLKEKIKKVNLKIIKNGKIIKEIQVEVPFFVSFYDYNLRRPKSYYRLEIKAKGLHLITNPIFVERVEL